MKKYPYVQISDIAALPTPQEGTRLIGHYSFQYIDFTEKPDYALGHEFVDCCFFGCELVPGQSELMRDCLVLPRMGMVFGAFNPNLYDGESLYEGFNPGDPDSYGRSYDARIYADYLANETYCSDVKIMLARTLHDHSVYDAMMDFLKRYDPENAVGIMGGHGIKRSDEGYEKIVRISKELTERGKLMISGGGPGAMEATHFGAWMAGRNEEELQDALSMLVSAGDKDSYKWLDSAFRVREKYPQEEYCSLSIPTWLYGHEPSTPFSTHIAKFFTNSVREDMILSASVGGIIFTPGSAGTLQEIFQDAAKLHYGRVENTGPMIFLGRDFYEKIIPVYPFLAELVDRRKYKNLNLMITDEIDDVVDFVCRRR